MTRDEANSLTDRIEILFGRTYPKGSRDYIVAQLQTEPIGICMTFMDDVLGHSQMLPTPKGLVESARKQSALLREKEADSRKKEFQDAPTIFQRKYEDKMHRQAVKLIKAKLGGLISREDFLTGIRCLDDQYPGAGWAADGSRLQHFWELGKKS